MANEYTPAAKYKALVHLKNRTNPNVAIGHTWHPGDIIDAKDLSHLPVGTLQLWETSEENGGRGLIERYEEPTTSRSAKVSPASADSKEG